MVTQATRTPALRRGFSRERNWKDVAAPPAAFPPLIPTPTRVTDTREASLNRTPGTPTQAQENSLSSGPSAGTPTSAAWGLDWRRLRDYHPHLGALLAWDVCSSGASSLAAFPEIQFSFLLGPAHSWPQKAGFSNQPWEKRSAFIIAPSE